MSSQSFEKIFLEGAEKKYSLPKGHCWRKLLFNLLPFGYVVSFLQMFMIHYSYSFRYKPALVVKPRKESD